MGPLHKVFMFRCSFLGKRYSKTCSSVFSQFCKCILFFFCPFLAITCFPLVRKVTRLEVQLNCRHVSVLRRAVNLSSFCITNATIKSLNTNLSNLLQPNERYTKNPFPLLVVTRGLYRRPHLIVLPLKTDSIHHALELKTIYIRSKLFYIGYIKTEN